MVSRTIIFNLKYRIGLKYFNSKKVDGILQEVYSKLIMFNVTSVITNSVDIPDMKAEEYEKNKKKSCTQNEGKLCRRNHQCTSLS